MQLYATLPVIKQQRAEEIEDDLLDRGQIKTTADVAALVNDENITILSR